MREAFKRKMEGKKKKKISRQVKLSTKSKVISKGTAYSDKYESRRKLRLAAGTSKRGITNAAMNRLGQKHANLNLGNVAGIAMTKAQKKKLAKKKAREQARLLKEGNTEMDEDWESASSEEEEKEEEKA